MAHFVAEKAAGLSVLHEESLGLVSMLSMSAGARDSRCRLFFLPCVVANDRMTAFRPRYPSSEKRSNTRACA